MSTRPPTFQEKMQEVAAALTPMAQRFFFLVQVVNPKAWILDGKTDDDRDLVFAAILGLLGGDAQEAEAVAAVQRLRKECAHAIEAWNVGQSAAVRR